MGASSKADFSKKHGSHVQVDPAIKAAVKKRLQNDTLTCATAFDIARTLGVDPAEVGVTLDLMRCRLIECQLGLFGYRPRKRIVKAQDTALPELKKAVMDGLIGGKLPCRTAWNLAAQFNVSKIKVSNNCEAWGIKIKPCQLGAF